MHSNQVSDSAPTAVERFDLRGRTRCSLDTRIPADAQLWLWWDYGYAAQYYARRTTFADSGSLPGWYPLAHTTTSPRQMIHFAVAERERQRKGGDGAAAPCYFPYHPMRRLKAMAPQHRSRLHRQPRPQETETASGSSAAAAVPGAGVGQSQQRPVDHALRPQQRFLQMEFHSGGSRGSDGGTLRVTRSACGRGRFAQTWQAPLTAGFLFFVSGKGAAFAPPFFRTIRTSAGLFFGHDPACCSAPNRPGKPLRCAPTASLTTPQPGTGPVPQQVGERQA